MGSRRQAREAAVQILYLRDINPHEALDDSLTRFWENQNCDAETKAFAEVLARGTLEKRPDIDEQIKKVTENWDLDRIAAVDRNILRLAIYEMMFCADVPPNVVLNEAIDLAKYFSNAEAGRFVNGVLDKLNKEIHGPAKRG